VSDEELQGHDHQAHGVENSNERQRLCLRLELVYYVQGSALVHSTWKLQGPPKVPQLGPAPQPNQVLRRRQESAVDHELVHPVPLYFERVHTRLRWRPVAPPPQLVRQHQGHHSSQRIHRVQQSHHLSSPKTNL